MSARLRALAGTLSPVTVRVLSGVLLLAVLVGVLAIGQVGVDALVLLLSAVALWEFRGLSGHLGFQAPSWLLFPLGVYLAFSGTLLRAVPLPAALGLVVVAGLSAFLALPPGRGEGVGRWAMGVAGALYVGLPMNSYLLLYASAHRAPGLAWLLVVIVSVVASDVAAFFTGTRLGRHPFFPLISPRKTVEGAVAGLIGSSAVFLAGGLALLHLPAWWAAGLGLLTGVTAQAGDLVESQMKRLAGVKDSSNLIPGHGGLLDRIDSALFPPIVVYLAVSYLGLQ